MGAGAFVEPLVVITLLIGGTWINRNTNYKLFHSRMPRWTEKNLENGYSESSDMVSSPVIGERTYAELNPAFPGRFSEPKWRVRTVGILGIKFGSTSPNTRVFKDYFLSRLLLKFPFLVEAWYWALIYWLGRAFTAVNLVQGTVETARRHALQVIHLEQKLHIFWEPAIQSLFREHETMMHWINRIYSYIHIPGTIFFLVWLYYYTTPRTLLDKSQSGGFLGESRGSLAGPQLYEARRRTMALCNLLAFIVFTAWPCMPPRLLSDKSVQSEEGKEARSYGFVDTVHGASGESSIWTENRFCNQYANRVYTAAAMPSLHFGYALMIGLTVALVPLSPHHRPSRRDISLPIINQSLRLPSFRRMLCILVGFTYPFIILVAIISTANHFVLDAVAGACVCAAGWWGNSTLLNLLTIEDYFLWCVRIHKPQRHDIELDVEDEEQEASLVTQGVPET